MLYCTPRGQYPWGSVTGRPGPLTSSPPWRSGRSGSHPLEATSSDPRPPLPPSLGIVPTGEPLQSQGALDPLPHPPAISWKSAENPQAEVPPPAASPTPTHPKKPTLGEVQPFLLPKQKNGNRCLLSFPGLTHPSQPRRAPGAGRGAGGEEEEMGFRGLPALLLPSPQGPWPPPHLLRGLTLPPAKPANRKGLSSW